ncbi:ABC transporter substrate-binding protein [Synechococcus sp. M16CYN]|uniref:ABC transporter substrate-binding protein n=1 Tax=Synechococcus sp. M16CYN TaxID=3103139 RepID=UPI0030E2D75F
MKLFVQFFSGLIFLLICAGVVRSGASQAEPVSILMPAPYADANAGLVKAFNREYRGKIHLNVIRGPLETESISDLAISSLLLGDTAFDALLIDVTWLPKYAASGWLEPLDPWFDETSLDGLVLGAQLGNHYDNHLYRWPLVADIGLLYWRTDLMQEPPATPQDLSDMAIDLVKSKRVANGFVWQGRQYEGLSCNFVEILHAFGGIWINPTTGQVELNKPSATRAAQWMRTLISDGASPKAVTNQSESESLQAFKYGDAALMRNWPYAWAELQKPESKVRGKVGVTLMVAEPDHDPAATIGSWGLSLLKQSRHREATVKAIRFLTSETAQRQRFRDQGYTPTELSLFSDPELVAMSPVLPEIAKALRYSVQRPSSPIYAQLSDVLQRQLNGLLTIRMVKAKDSVERIMERTYRKSELILKATGAKL